MQIIDPSITTSSTRLKISEGTLRELIQDGSYQDKGFEAFHVDGPVARGASANGFLGAALEAFDQHLPLTLDPADVWTVLLQGASLHLSLHGETLRPVFVDHDGQEKIVVIRDEFVKGDPSNDWGGVFEELASKATAAIKTPELFRGEWSTSTSMSRGVSSLAVLGALRSYFRYEVHTRCGVPSYNLLGTAEDWRVLKNKALALATTLEMSWWIPKLTSFFAGVEAAWAGSPDLSFWRSFVKHESMSGGSTVTGHILGLFPYTQDRSRKLTPLEGAQASSGAIPCGVIRVPFVWQYLSTRLDMFFAGGFVGVHQDLDTLALRPGRGWAVLH